MTDQKAKPAPSQRTVAQSEGRAFDDDRASPLHREVGIKDEPWEHEDERLNPGGHEGSGAPAGAPKSPSNSA